MPSNYLQVNQLKGIKSQKILATECFLRASPTEVLNKTVS
jgi:hypothetical protein